MTSRVTGRRSRHPGHSRPTAGGLCQKGWTAARAADRAGPAHHAAGPRTAASCGRRLGRGARPRRRPASAPCSDEHGPDAVAVFGGGGLTNEKAYQLGKFARVALRHPPASTTTAGSACPRPRRPATGPSASTAGCRSRSTDLAGPTRSCWSAATSPRPCRRSSGTWPRSAERRRAHRRRPAGAPRRPRQADLHLQPTPGTDLALAARPAARRGHRGPRRRGVRRRSARRASTRSARSVAAVVARAGRADHRRAGRPDCASAVRAARRRRTGRADPHRRAAPSSTPRAPTR